MTVRATLVAAGAVGLLAAGALPLAISGRASAAQAFLASWALFFVLGYALNAVEAELFSRAASKIRLRHGIGAIGFAAVAALAVAWIAGSSEGAGSWSAAFDRYFARRSAQAWTLRIGGTAATYIGIHGVIGSATWPFVRSHYLDPTNGLALRIPKPSVLLPFQFLRGLAGVAAVLPWLVLAPAAGIDGWARLSLVLAVTMGVVPLLLAPGWPLRLRVIHAVEITVIALLFSLSIWRFVAA